MKTNTNNLPGITDTFRRSDISGGTPIVKKARVRKPRVMFAVVSDGRDLGAYRTRELAQTEADKLTDAYVTECTR